MNLPHRHDNRALKCTLLVVGHVVDGDVELRIVLDVDLGPIPAKFPHESDGFGTWVKERTGFFSVRTLSTGRSRNVLGYNRAC